LATFAARSTSSHALSVSFRGREPRPRGAMAEGLREVAREAIATASFRAFL
jgi:hypothetical protein